MDFDDHECRLSSSTSKMQPLTARCLFTRPQSLLQDFDVLQVPVPEGFTNDQTAPVNEAPYLTVGRLRPGCAGGTRFLARRMERSVPDACLSLRALQSHAGSTLRKLR